MILAVDVHYRQCSATAAGVLFAHWQDAAAERELVTEIQGIEDYQPGQFYKRELPCILQLIAAFDLRPQVIVIDGLVYLNGATQPGMGCHLYEAFERSVAVVGVAKKRFRTLPESYALLRGGSKRPLYVTAAGMSLESARARILSMHGPNRMPLLLKRVDQLSRGIADA
ncbi:endonuclease V [Marinobacterium arenosum]|uniref:endonuclease V n=1 Tax=Marinobacterium arenosum TaxID=2862496 RepID=UPI001C982DC5|nr:endonuclease V [Marinobacterium arenosum]MBY4675220.1 endonuclease V [Marinobacterium arenosum]